METTHGKETHCQKMVLLMFPSHSTWITFYFTKLHFESSARRRQLPRIDCHTVMHINPDRDCCNFAKICTTRVSKIHHSMAAAICVYISRCSYIIRLLNALTSLFACLFECICHVLAAAHCDFSKLGVAEFAQVFSSMIALCTTYRRKFSVNKSNINRWTKQMAISEEETRPKNAMSQKHVTDLYFDDVEIRLNEDYIRKCKMIACMHNIAITKVRGICWNLFAIFQRPWL